jgi:glutathione-regulated potassium-efflux system ancillary protein KefC/glutathione-regulated potassium-efflux system protein KefB
VLILIVTISMALTPLVLKLIARLVPDPGLDESELVSLLPPDEAQDILIAGFGRFGQILGRVLNAKGINYTAIDRNPEQVQLIRRFGNKVYFGDATKQGLLDKAHAGTAKVLALCIDDVENSITVVRVVKQHYPRLRIFARARNRFHEIRLRELGVDFVIRETFYSALMFTRGVLDGIGYAADEIEHSITAFQRQDQKLLEQQAAIIDDQASMIQTSQQAAEELRSLLQQDVKE